MPTNLFQRWKDGNSNGTEVLMLPDWGILTGESWHKEEDQQRRRSLCWVAEEKEDEKEEKEEVEEEDDDDEEEEEEDGLQNKKFL